MTLTTAFTIIAVTLVYLAIQKTLNDVLFARRMQALEENSPYPAYFSNSAQPSEPALPEESDYPLDRAGWGLVADLLQELWPDAVYQGLEDIGLTARGIPCYIHNSEVFIYRNLAAYRAWKKEHALNSLKQLKARYQRGEAEGLHRDMLYVRSDEHGRVTVIFSQMAKEKKQRSPHETP